MWIWELLESVLAVIGKFLDWRISQDRRAQENLDAIKKRDLERQKAEAAREAVRADVAANDGRVPDDDPFVRD